MDGGYDHCQDDKSRRKEEMVREGGQAMTCNGKDLEIKNARVYNYIHYSPPSTHQCLTGDGHTD